MNKFLAENNEQIVSAKNFEIAPLFYKFSLSQLIFCATVTAPFTKDYLSFLIMETPQKQ